MNSTTLAPLREMAYPGRGIILGRLFSGDCRAVVYFITGRSAASKARVLVRQGDAVWTRPEDEVALKDGNPELLIYPALIAASGVAVSNGRQTSDIAAALAAGGVARTALEQALSGWDYEPDPPIYTPRISGCLTTGGAAAMSLVRRTENDRVAREVFDLAPAPGRGFLVTTYRGNAEDPIGNFEGPPRDVLLAGGTAAELAEEVYAALAPQKGAPDFRVALACFTVQDGVTGWGDLCIINRRERD